MTCSLPLAAGVVLCSLIPSPAQERPDKDPLESVFLKATKDSQSGAYLEAERGFRQVLGKQPDNPAALANLGILYAKMHRYTEAADQYKHALRVVPTQEAIQLNLGLAYLKQNEYELALPYFSHLHELHPENARVTTLTATSLAYTGQAPVAISLLEPLTTAHTDDRAALYLLGIAYMRSGRTQDAREILGRVFAEAPPPQASFLLGEAYAQATDYASAAEAFRAALVNDPHLLGAHRELGRTYLGMHRTSEAEQELRTAVSMDPADASALYSLGALLVQASRFSEGQAFLEQAQRLAPDSWATAFYLGKAAYEMHHVVVAAQQLRRAAELNPDEPGAPYLLARILRSQGKLEESDKWMQRVSTLHATSLDAEKRAIESANREDTHERGSLP